MSYSSMAAVGNTNNIIDEFGEYNSDGVWIPKEYEGTFGNNGFHLDFMQMTPILEMM